MARFSQEYLDYMDSPEWQETRERKLQQAGWKCERCGRTRDDGVILQVHHWTYERLGYEDDVDLEVLCEDHHQRADTWRKAGGTRYDWEPTQHDPPPTSGVRRTLRRVSGSAPAIYRYRVHKDDDGTFRVGISFMGIEAIAADGIVDPMMSEGLADRLQAGQVVIADLDIIRATTPRQIPTGF